VGKSGGVRKIHKPGTAIKVVIQGISSQPGIDVVAAKLL
jgi:hypothetical protein